MIQVADAVLVGILAAIVAITPKANRLIAWLLFAEFCIFVGFDVYMKSKGWEAGVISYSIKSMLSTSFILIFAIAGAKYLKGIFASTAYYLAGLSAIIAFYQLIGIRAGLWYVESYWYVMLGFCILQLGGLLPGVLHGHRFKRSLDSNDRRSTTRHHYSN